MNLRTLQYCVILTLTPIVLVRPVQAQEFIPDTLVRNWLNQQIPGIVDANGIMDTLNPGIANLDTAAIGTYDNLPTVDLHGIQFLDSLREFVVNISQDVPCSITSDGLPPSLSHLNIFMSAGSLELPALPDAMEQLAIYGMNGSYGYPDVLISSLNDSLTYMTIRDVNTIEWPGDGFVQSLSADWSLSPPDLSFALPTVHAYSVYVGSCYFVHLDLSSVTAKYLALSNVGLLGPIQWPQDLKGVTMSNCIVETPLSNFPSSLESLYSMMTWGFCLPWLPESVSELTMFDWDGCLPNWPTALEFAFLNSEMVYDTTANYCSVLNSSCPGTNPGISGHILMDVNQNGQADPGEPPLPQASVTLLPNGNVTGCDASGYWEIGVQPGNYTITPNSSYPYYQSILPAQHTAELPNMGDADTLNDFAVTLIPDIEDLRAHFYAEPARPGFDNRLYLTCQNYGTVPMDAQLTLDFDGDQTWVGSSLAPNTQSTTSATWNFTGMGIGTSQTLTVDLNTASSVLLGTPIAHLLTASPMAGDETPLDNVIAYIDSVVGSFDPNDKSVKPARMSPVQVQSGEERITYTIRFQNTGTYLAERVLILDTLSEDLQWQSIEFLASSHTNHWFVLDGVLHVFYENINLPDSTSDEENSHGFIQFSILPQADLVDGATITNIAHIVFDFNAPIVTPPAVFQVDVLASVQDQAGTSLRIYPNPVRDQMRIVLGDGTSAPLNYTVQDLLGRTTLQGRSGSQGLVEVNTLRAGVYMLTTTLISGPVSLRFVKQ